MKRFALLLALGLLAGCASTLEPKKGFRER
jgi:hypothetical protein